MENKIKVYFVFSATQIILLKKQILMIFSLHKGFRNGKIDFVMSDVTAFFIIRNTNRFNSTSIKTNAIQSSTDADNYIRTFFAKTNEIFAQQYAKKQISIPYLFPNQLRLYYYSVIKNVTLNTIDRWECEYRLELSPESNEQAVPVTGASVVITICANGDIIGIDYNMRPIESIKRTERFNIFKVNEETIPNDTQLIYLFSSDKNVYAPFYLSNVGEGSTINSQV